MDAPDHAGRLEGEWTECLRSCPMVALIDVVGDAARIEYGGVEGRAWHAGAGLCIGLKLAIAAPAREWIEATTLTLGAIPSACDDALTCEDGEWYLWRRHDLGGERPSLRERLDAQAALAGRLAETALPTGRTDGTEIGRWI